MSTSATFSSRKGSVTMTFTDGSGRIEKKNLKACCVPAVTETRRFSPVDFTWFNVDFARLPRDRDAPSVGDDGASCSWARALSGCICVPEHVDHGCDVMGAGQPADSATARDEAKLIYIYKQMQYTQPDQGFISSICHEGFNLAFSAETICSTSDWWENQ